MGSTKVQEHSKPRSIALSTDKPIEDTDSRPHLDADSDISPTVSIVMPTMNEEAGIRECIESVRTAVQASGYHTEVIISDDSTDRTPEIARELGAIVVEPDQPGYGYAYRYAFERCRGDYIVIGDADTTINCIVRPVVNGAFHSPLVSVSGTDGERTLGLVNGRPAS